MSMNENREADDARKVVRRIIGAGPRLPNDLHRNILDLRATAVPALREILEDQELAVSKAPGGGCAPAHAARLLGELRAADAVEPMLRMLARTDWADILHDQIIQSLPEIGAAVVEPALRAYADYDTDNFRHDVCAVLAEAGVRDDRIFEILVDQLLADPSRAGNLAIYGDERAVPHLLEALDRYEVVESESPLANHALIELRAAIEELGGTTLTTEQQLKCRPSAPKPSSSMGEAIEIRTDPPRRGGTRSPAIVAPPPRHPSHLTERDGRAKNRAETTGWVPGHR
jgi:hypothetical protein